MLQINLLMDMTTRDLAMEKVAAVFSLLIREATCNHLLFEIP